MNPISRTLTFAGVAAVSAVLAYAAMRGSQPNDVQGFDEVGEAFFAEFEDPTKAAALTVIDYDKDEKEAVAFAVKQNVDGLWVIPSHHDYPAEAEDRLAKTATSLMGVKKTAVKSRSKDDWKLYGVVEPDSEGTAAAEERGTRLTLSDGSSNPLVDLIIGNKVEGRDGQFYVREPGKPTTFVAQLDVDLSAKFSDWIEPDLLKISSADVVKITLDNYSINEQRGTVEKKELLEFNKEDLQTTGDWKLAGIDEEAEELDNSPVSAIATNLDQLKIVGVRPKPEGLDDSLRVNPAVKQILQMQMQAQGYFIGGDRDGNERLYANEGELVAGINNGVQYTLYFGEIARGTGKDIEVGLSKEEGGDKSESDDGDAAEGDKKDTEGATATEEEADADGPRRYLLVKVDFDEKLLGEKPVAPVEPLKPPILNEAEQPETDAADTEKAGEPAAEDKDTPAADTPAADTPAADTPAADTPAADESATDTPAADESATDESATDESAADESAAAAPADPSETQDDAAKESQDETSEEPKVDPKKVAQEAYDAVLSKYRTDKAKYDSDLTAYEDKFKAGQEKAKELSTRFAGWYYVISSDSFEKFRIERKDVVSAKEKPEEPTEPKPGEPKPAEPKPAEPKPAEPKPTEPKPAEPKPAEPKPTEPKPAEPKPAEPKPAEPKPAEPKPAEPKPAEPKPTDGKEVGDN